MQTFLKFQNIKDGINKSKINKKRKSKINLSEINNCKQVDDYKKEEIIN